MRVPLRRTVLILYVASLTILLTILPNHLGLAQETTTGFPHISGHRMIGIDLDNFSISNDAEYIYSCSKYRDDCGIWDTLKQQPISSRLFEGDYGAYWSFDNSELITSVVDNNCQFPPNTFSTVLFDMPDHTTSNKCLPINVSLSDWSPVSGNILSIGNKYLLDTKSLELTEFSHPTDVSIGDIGHYLGYGNMLWDVDSGLPVAEVSVKQNLQLGQIIGSSIQICTLSLEHCPSILNTLSISNVDVFDVKLDQHWMLWAGDLSRSGQAVSNQFNVSNRSDTLLYLTNLSMGETQELFEFSSLSRPDLYVKQMAWSPDAATIALALGALNPPTPPPPGLESTANNYDAGILVLNLTWPTS